MTALKTFYKSIGSNYDYIKNRLDSDAFILHLITSFKEDENFAQLKSALLNGDTAHAFRAAHTLKGVCANLEFTLLFQACAAMTELLRNNDLVGAAAVLPEAEKQYTAILQAAETLFADFTQAAE